jgi:hypothetical protein
MFSPPEGKVPTTKDSVAAPEGIDGAAVPHL